MSATTGLKTALRNLNGYISRHINRWSELMADAITNFTIPYTIGSIASQPKTGEVLYSPHTPQEGEINPPVYDMSFWDGTQWVTVAGSTSGVPTSIVFPHFDDDTLEGGLFREINGGSPFPAHVIWWTDSGKTVKVKEKLITRDAQQRPLVIVWKFYQNGNLIRTTSDTITYSGSSVVETSRTRTVT